MKLPDELKHDVFPKLEPNKQYDIEFLVDITNPDAELVYRMVIDESEKAMKNNDGESVEIYVKLK